MSDTEGHIEAGIREAARRSVPWPTIWATIAAVIITLAAIMLLMEVRRVLTWIFMAMFLAVALNPLVEAILRRFPMRRGFAVSIVIVGLLAVVFGIIFAFAYPLVNEGQQFAKDLPRYVEDAKAGKGPVGELVTRYDLETKINENQDQIQATMNQLGSRSLKILGAVGNVVIGTLTVFVITFLMLFEGPVLIDGISGLLPERQRDRISRIASDCGRAVTGYVAGNLFISVIAAALTYVFLWIFGVPFKGVLAMFIAVVDLVPLVGATIGAAVVILVATLHSPTAGIAAFIFFVVYQQFENHVLQPVVQARTVKLLPLTVLVSVLLGTELAGMLGALLAIPVAAMVKVLARELWESRRAIFGADAPAPPAVDPAT